jgi:hypothetical protein
MALESACLQRAEEISSEEEGKKEERDLLPNKGIETLSDLNGPRKVA